MDAASGSECIIVAPQPRRRLTLWRGLRVLFIAYAGYVACLAHHYLLLMGPRTFFEMHLLKGARGFERYLHFAANTGVSFVLIIITAVMATAVVWCRAEGARSPRLERWYTVIAMTFFGFGTLLALVDAAARFHWAGTVSVGHLADWLLLVIAMNLPAVVLGTIVLHQRISRAIENRLRLHAARRATT